jgi:hypothetical protein
MREIGVGLYSRLLDSLFRRVGGGSFRQTTKQELSMTMKTKMAAALTLILLCTAKTTPANADKGWKWVPWISYCEVTCSPTLDPEGSEYCDCWR